MTDFLWIGRDKILRSSYSWTIFIETSTLEIENNCMFKRMPENIVFKNIIFESDF